MSIFLGAGFSKWAANLPLAKELFDFNIRLWGPREERNLRLIQDLKNAWDRSHPSEEPEFFVSYALSLGQKERKILQWYIARRLTDEFISFRTPISRRRHVFVIDEKLLTQHEGVVKAKKFLHSCIGIDTPGIITTNYDMLIEYALSTKGFNYGKQGQYIPGPGKDRYFSYRYPVTVEGVTPLAKLHGSINRNNVTYFSDGRGGINGKALIVPPTRGKHPPRG